MDTYKDSTILKCPNCDTLVTVKGWNKETNRQCGGGCTYFNEGGPQCWFYCPSCGGRARKREIIDHSKELLSGDDSELSRANQLLAEIGGSHG